MPEGIRSFRRIMRTVTLSKNNMSIFKDMDPFDVAASIRNQMPVAWGIFRSDGEDDQSSPVGLLLGEVVGKELIIRWIFVIPKYREHSYGEALLDKCFYFADKRKLETLSVYLDTDYAKSRACLGAGEFFRAHLFNYVTTDHMVAKVEDYKNQVLDPPYSVEDEALCLYMLFGDENPEDYNPNLK